MHSRVGRTYGLSKPRITSAERRLDLLELALPEDGHVVTEREPEADGADAPDPPYGWQPGHRLAAGARARTGDKRER
jgi:hypothetical protein